MFHEVLSHPFLCRVAWCSASARPCFVSRLCEAVVPRLCERRSLMQIPRATLLHKSRSVVKLCDILSIHCFQLARVVFVCFFLGPVVEVFVHISHMMSHRTCVRALDQFVCFPCATCLLDSSNQNMSHRVLLSAIFSEHHKCHPADRYFHKVGPDSVNPVQTATQRVIVKAKGVAASPARRCSKNQRRKGQEDLTSLCAIRSARATMRHLDQASRTPSGTDDRIRGPLLKKSQMLGAPQQEGESWTRDCCGKTS